MTVPQVVKIVLQEAVEVPLNILAGIVENHSQVEAILQQCEWLIGLMMSIVH